MLAFITESPARGQLCASPEVSYHYDGSTIPEQAPEGAWLVYEPWTAGSTWSSDGNVLRVEACASGGSAAFYRPEEALAEARSVVMEVRARITCRAAAGWLPPVYLGFGFSDGQKVVLVSPGGMPENGQVGVNWWENLVLSPEGSVDWGQFVDFRLELDKRSEDPSRHELRVYANGGLLLTVPYWQLDDAGTLPEGITSPHIFGIGADHSDTDWDYVNYSICMAAPERPSVAEQIENLRDELGRLDAPQTVKVWLGARLEQAGREEDPERQGQIFYQASRQLFMMKHAGVVRDDAGRFETLLDFARDTVAPQLDRRDGYLNRIEITAASMKSSRVVPGKVAASMRLFITLRPTGSDLKPRPGRKLVVYTRVGIVRENTGEIVFLGGYETDVPADLEAGRSYELEPIDARWFGDTLDGGLAPVGDRYIMVATGELAEVDTVTGIITGYSDQAANLGQLESALNDESCVHGGRHFEVAAEPTGDMDMSWMIGGGVFFINTADCVPAAGSDRCDPVLHIIDPDTGEQVAWTDDCVWGMNRIIPTVWNGAVCCLPDGRCGEQLCPDLRSDTGRLNPCLTYTFDGELPRFVVRASGNLSRGSTELQLWRVSCIQMTGLFCSAYRFDMLAGPWETLAGGTKVCADGGWYWGDEIDAIVPSPEKVESEGGVRPVSGAALYLLDGEGGLERRGVENGMWRGARLSNLSGRSNGILVVASTGDRAGTASLYINDVVHAKQRDGDGLGEELEAEICADNGACLDPDNADTDGDGIFDGFEVLGIRTEGTDYPEQALPTWGADPLHKDVFVETDYFKGKNGGPDGQPMTIKGAEFMNKVSGKCSGSREYLANPDGRDGFSIHVDNGISSPNETMYGDWGGVGLIPKDDCLQYEYGWRYHMNPVRHGIFHYGGGCPGGTGNSSVGYPYFYFNSLGTQEKKLPGKYAIHELGHNLGLQHYGIKEDGSSFNFKPHYISLMNYAYEYGSPNASNNFYWDPDNLRFSHGERRYVLDSAGRRTGEEYYIDPAAIDEGLYWLDIPSDDSSTYYDLSHGASGWSSYPWYLVERTTIPGWENAWLFIDWNRDGTIQSGSPVKADVLIDESAVFKFWEFNVPIRYGPKLVAHQDVLYVFFVREDRPGLRYRLYSEGPDCDPEDIGPGGQDNLPANNRPHCGDWRGEVEISRDADIKSQFSVIKNPATGRIDVFYLDSDNRLCVLSGYGYNWRSPSCEDMGLWSEPEAVSLSDKILVFGIGEPEEDLYRVYVIEIPASDPDDTREWRKWPTAILSGNEWHNFTSLFTPAVAVDPVEDKIWGIFTVWANPAETDPWRHEMRMFTNTWGGYVFFEEIPRDKVWLNRPLEDEFYGPPGLESRYTDNKPALVVERFYNGLPRWTLWLHCDTENEDDACGFFRMVSTLAHSGGQTWPAFSHITLGSPNQVNDVRATRRSGFDIEFYKGKLRAVISYDVGRGDVLKKGYIFFPIADGVFHARLKDVNDVEIIRENMASSLGPLFHGMGYFDKEKICNNNHIDLIRCLLRSKSSDLNAFDGEIDEDIKDLNCFPDWMRR